MGPASESIKLEYEPVRCTVLAERYHPGSTTGVADLGRPDPTGLPSTVKLQIRPQAQRKVLVEIRNGLLAEPASGHRWKLSG